MNKKKIALGVAGAGVALLAIGALAAPAEEQAEAPTTTPAPETTEAPETTQAPTTTQAKEIPTTTTVEVDEFEAWLLDQYPTIIDVAGDMQSLAPLMDAGDIAGAASLSTDIGDVFGGLYLDAPETGTELSDVANNMLLTCSVAYDAGGSALSAVNVQALETATVMIGDCADLLNEVTALLP